MQWHLEMVSVALNALALERNRCDDVFSRCVVVSMCTRHIEFEVICKLLKFNVIYAYTNVCLCAQMFVYMAVKLNEHSL